MLFTSLEFLFAFFPITIIVYFICPKKFKNYWLMCVSLFFYAWGEPFFLFVMLASIVFNYCCALGISANSGNEHICRGILTVAVVGNIGIIFVYKYMNFITANIRTFFPFTAEFIPQTAFVLPIGISFFTFQALSYVVDVYRGIPVQKNICNLCLYISFFPQLIAGPIVRYTTIAEQINDRAVTADSFYEGVIRFLYGFNKKMLLANVLASVADVAFASEELSVAMSWLGIACYTLQIFFDFSGYSEMAIGLGMMFGFKFLENFNYPYISKTVTEFWRRWHMSLGSWFRDYVYFPLGGSRVKSKKRLVFNLFVVWFATGVWHGASWNFILWGVLYGVIITIEKLFNISEYSKEKMLFSLIYRIFTMLMVMCGWVLFRASDLPSALYYLKSMFGITGNSFSDMKALFYFKENLAVLLVAVICSTPFFKFLKEKIIDSCRYGGFITDSVIFGTQFALFMISISFLVMNAHNPFIYFNF